MPERKDGNTRQTKQIFKQLYADIQSAVDTGQLQLNRHQRRALAKHQRSATGLVGARIPEFTRIEPLVTSSSLLESEDDLELYLRELPKYESSQAMYRRYFSCHNLLLQHGIPDEWCRSKLAGKNDEKVVIPALPPLSPGNKQKILKAVTDVYGNKSSSVSVFYLDEDDDELMRTLSTTDIPVVDILREGIRARAETIALMKMQIAWLRSHPISPQEEIEVPMTQSESPVVPESTSRTSVQPLPGYNLAEWQVYWTEVPWSSDPSHLTHIPTSSRTEAVRAIGKIGRHEISVKPISIIRLLEFHLERSVLDRAMASRLKFVPDDIKDWVRLKRGKDRIPLLVPEGQTAIFFVGGRDEIYRNLKRL